MNDISSSVPSSAPPSSTPASSEPAHHDSGSTSTETLATLSASENPTEYIEQRREDSEPDASDDGTNTTDESRRLTRHEREKRRWERERVAKEKLQAENAALRAQQQAPKLPKLPEGAEEATDVGEWAEQMRAAAAAEAGEPGNGADNSAAQEPVTREEFIENAVAEIHENLARTIEEARQQTRQQTRQQAEHEHLSNRHAERVRQLASTIPGYAEDMQNAPGAKVQVRADVEHYILRSDLGPVLQHYYATVGEQEFAKVQQSEPQQALRMMDKREAWLRGRLEMAAQRAAAGRPTIPKSWSRKPIVPLRGSASPSPSVHDLANSDDATNYVKRRQQQMKAQSR